MSDEQIRRDAAERGRKYAETVYGPDAILARWDAMFASIGFSFGDQSDDSRRSNCDDMNAFETALQGRRVLVTGHTGFTGGWLVLWLRALGCRVSGLALPPDTTPNLFTEARIADVVASRIGDIRDFATVKAAFDEAEPEIVFHLAAQPLVSRGFDLPLDTIATNVLGTANVLEAARLCPTVKAVVCVTTDKVYADHASASGYVETDALGGADPYAASKAAAEMIAACYVATMAPRGNGCRIATARGGNIIGGGDWSKDRVVPDFVRAVVSRRPPRAAPSRAPCVRGSMCWRWCTVIFLWRRRLLEGDDGSVDAFNFGPSRPEAVSVGELVERLGKTWRRPELQITQGQFPETAVLQVNSDKARRELGWQPPLDLDRTIEITAEWYRDYYANPGQARDLTEAQIADYRRQLQVGAARFGNELKRLSRSMTPSPG